MNWRSTAWASDSLSWKAIFPILSVISQVLSFQLTHLCFSTGVTSPHGAHPSNTDTQVTFPAVHTRSPLTLFPSSSFGHFSPNTMQPSPSTSISPLGSISEGTNSRMMLIFQTNPCQTLLCHTCHLQRSAPSSWPKHSKATPAVFAICPCTSAAASTVLTRISCPKPPQVSPIPGFQLMAILHATRNDANWRARNTNLSMILANHLQKTSVSSADSLEQLPQLRKTQTL